MNTRKIIVCFIAVPFLLFIACKDDSINSKDLPPCETSMFGQPVEATGLSNDICNPSCECLGFTSKNFTPDQLTVKADNFAPDYSYHREPGAGRKKRRRNTADGKSCFCKVE